MAKRILIIDDSKIILRALGMKFESAGYEVLTAEDGSAGVRIARQEQPDLILLDVSFPPDVGHGGGVGWDGFLIMDWLRRMEEACAIPVIIITGVTPPFMLRELRRQELFVFSKNRSTTTNSSRLCRILSAWRNRPETGRA